MADSRLVYPVGGVNRLVDPLRIADNEAVSLKNIYPDEARKLKKRAGTAPYRAVDRNQNENDDFQALTGTPMNILFPKFMPEGYVMFESDGVSTWLTASCDPTAGRARNYKSRAWSDLRPPIIEFGGKIWASLGRIDQGDGIQVQNGGIFELRPTANNEFLYFPDQLSTGVFKPIPAGIVFKDSAAGIYYAPKLMAVYRGRMVYAGFDAPYQDYIIFSDRGLPKTIEVTPDISTVNFASTTRSFRALGLAGEKITAIREVALNSVANALESTLLILSENRCIVLSGEPLETTATGDYVGSMDPKVVQYKCGCSSPETIVTTPMGVVWAGPTDVWVYDGGSLPKPVGTKIRPILAQSPPDYRWQWHAVYHNRTGSYRLAVHSAGQVVDWEPETRLLLGEQWWLDLRAGIPESAAQASWFGPQVYAPSILTLPGTPAPVGVPFMALKDQSADTSEKVILVHSPSGVLSVMMEADAQEGYDSAGATDATYGVYGETGNEISIEMVSKKFDFDEVEHDKLLLGLSGGLQFSELLSLTAVFAADGKRARVTREVFPEQLGLVGGVDSWSVNGDKEYQGILIEPSDDQRVNFKTLQFLLNDKPGWIVPYDGLGRYVIVKTPAGVETLVALTPGFYAANSDYWTMIAGVLGPILGAAMTFTLTGTPARFVKVACPVNWFPVYLSTDPLLTEEYKRSSRKVWGSLGFDTSANPPVPGVTGEFTAANVVRQKLSSALDIADLWLHVHHFNRKASGGRYEPKIA